MCVSAAPARFTRTTVYAGEARRNGDLVHVAGYENSVQNRVHSRSWLRRFGVGGNAGTGNAMLLHFPAVPGSMTSANVVDTEQCPRILADMVTALRPQIAPAGFLQPTTVVDPVEVFEHGIYTVVLAPDARSIAGALDRIPDHKRPPLNERLFDWYHASFPGWPVALCCFDTTDTVRATPMLWWYPPAYPDYLFAPAIDCHTGSIPNLQDPVDVDHWVVLGSTAMAADLGRDVRYRDRLPTEVEVLLPERVVGARFEASMPNADFVSPIEAVRRGRAVVERRLLPAAG